MLWIAAAGGNTDSLETLAVMRHDLGDYRGAEQLARQAAAAVGRPRILTDFARGAKEVGDYKTAIRWYRAAVDAGADGWTMRDLADLLVNNPKNSAEAERLYRAAVAAGCQLALADVISMRAHAGDYEEAEQLAGDDPDNLFYLAHFRKRGNPQEAERMRQKAATLERRRPLVEPTPIFSAAEQKQYIAEKQQALQRRQTMSMKEAGDRDGAGRMLRTLVAAGDEHAVTELTQLRAEAGDWEGAERLSRNAAAAGYQEALSRLVGMRQGSERERLRRIAVDAGNLYALSDLAHSFQNDGREVEAARCRRYGLEVDGTLAEPWEWPAIE
ncbi:hypothetical protein [Streptomyces fagopyri]|uniref:hypothetical protein n=1 Tax=Streptomyces fagopyri TaxID=2662397 RepID=UPI0037159449